MLIKKILNYKLLSLSFLVIIISLLSIFYFIKTTLINDNQTTYVQKIDSASQTTTPKAVVNFGAPTRLIIPQIKVDSFIESVGLTPEGAMDTPQKQENVAWFKLGQRPGDLGSAVIAGHYGWKDKKPSVFDNLYKLRIGDKIYVTDDQGNNISFVVRENKRYTASYNAEAVFTSNDGQSHLNLVTCEGSWNETSKSYPTRLVVFTDKE
jgi:LPXTG-site transpeptidase (sortase) family protein